MLKCVLNEIKVIQKPFPNEEKWCLLFDHNFLFISEICEFLTYVSCDVILWTQHGDISQNVEHLWKYF